MDIESEDDEPHAATVVVERDDEVVQRATFDLPAMRNPEEPPYGAVRREVERTWTTDPAYVTLRGRVDGGEWRVADLDRYETDECWLATLRIDERGVWGWGLGSRPADRVLTPSPTGE